MIISHDPSLGRYLCSSANEIPEAARESIPDVVKAALGGNGSSLDHALALAFPLTFLRIDQLWGQLRLHLTSVNDLWLYQPVLQKGELNLFFGWQAFRSQILDETFEEDHAMLPNRWRELYRNINSFSVTSYPLHHLGWKNTPFGYEGRMRIPEFCHQSSIKPTLVKKMTKRYAIAEAKVACWLWSDSGDSLWIDEGRCDQKVYHVVGSAFEDAQPLDDPEEALDAYLAHVVGGGDPKLFNFRTASFL